MRLCESIGMELLDNPVVVDIQNVADFMHEAERPDAEDRVWDPTADFPCWLSPWPRALYEWKAYTLDAGRVKVAAFVETHQTDAGFEARVALWSANPRPTLFPYWLGYRLESGGAHDGSPIGSLATAEDNQTLVDAGLDAGDLLPNIFPVFMTNSLLACRNVRTVDVVPASRLARAQERKHGVPKVTYKILDIGGMRSVLMDEGQSATVGLRRAMHICRGHFATYSPEHPLFGKYTGRFWRPMHIRGQREVGMINKDYRVRA